MLTEKVNNEPDLLSVELVFSMLNDLKEACNNINVKQESYLDSIGDISDGAINEKETQIKDIQDI